MTKTVEDRLAALEQKYGVHEASVAHLREKIIACALNAASVKSNGRYLEHDGKMICVSRLDRERWFELFRDQAMEAAEQLVAEKSLGR